MASILQMNLNVTTRAQAKRTWAVAVSKDEKARMRRLSFRQAVITACSKEAKAQGVRAGMRCEEAKLLAPEMKVLILGNS
jgi:nucleotidyltransferase/DNA polymerase involved in DNA repair